MRLQRLASSNVTESSADVSWTDNNTPASSLFEVSIGAPGFTAGSGTETFVNSASESFTGLADGTTYDVYVRANCGVNGTWSAVGSFTTPRTPPAVAQGVTCTYEVEMHRLCSLKVSVTYRVGR